jgi:hypothetical protein
MALRFIWRDTHFQTHSVLLPKMRLTAPMKIGSSVSGRSGTAYLRYALRIGVMRSGLSEPDIGEKEGSYMKSKIKYTDEPMGELKVVRDFLPPPHELVFEEDTVKVTIGLSRSSVDFFKREAKRNHTAYQKMIRRLLDVYASRYEHGVPTR